MKLLQLCHDHFPKPRLAYNTECVVDKNLIGSLTSSIRINVGDITLFIVATVIDDYLKGI